MLRSFKPINTPTLIPSLFTPSPIALMDFYANAFGFEMLGEPVMEGGDTVHLTMAIPGEAQVMLMREGAFHTNSRSPKTMGSGEQGMGLYLYVEDVDAHYKRAVEAGASMSTKPEDMVWVDRIYTTFDIDGNRWTFATLIKD